MGKEKVWWDWKRNGHRLGQGRKQKNWVLVGRRLKRGNTHPAKNKHDSNRDAADVYSSETNTNTQYNIQTQRLGQKNIQIKWKIFSTTITTKQIWEHLWPLTHFLSLSARCLLLSSPVSIYHVQTALLLCNASLFPFIYTCCVIPAAPASAFGQIVISNKE